MRPFIHPHEDEVHLTQIMHALSDSSRLFVVLELLRLQNQPFDCQTLLPEVPAATRSHHFKVLRQSGLIESETIGTRHVSVVREEMLNRKFPGLLLMLKEQIGNLEKAN